MRSMSDKRTTNIYGHVTNLLTSYFDVASSFISSFMVSFVSVIFTKKYLMKAILF